MSTEAKLSGLAQSQETQVVSAGAPAVSIRGFTKSYRDGVFAVSDLTLDVPEGVICGFVGPNGAGKSTTFRFLATLLRPTRGDAYVRGVSVVNDPLQVRSLIGYMPEQYGLYEGMTVWEFLEFFGAAYGVPRVRRHQVIDDILALVDLSHKRDAFVNGLSRGMRQRLALARALMHDPAVLVLDEPAAGLDPRARIEMQELVRELRRMGKTIIISSHILSELAGLCDVIAFLEAGRLVAYGSLGDLRRTLQRHRSVQIDVLASEGPKAESVLRGMDCIQAIDRSGDTLFIEVAGPDELLAEVLTKLVSSGVHVVRFSERELTLEEVFLRVTEGIVS